MIGSDVIIIATVILLIPKLVEKHLRGVGFGRKLRMIIMIGGVFWILLSCGHGVVYSVLGVKEGDSRIYERYSKRVVQSLQSGDYGLNLRKLHDSVGRSFYEEYQGLVYYLTGGTVASILAINAFVAFWGGLVLTRLIYSFPSAQISEKSILPFFLIFMPSVVFWSSANIKEALMYWSICQVYSLAGFVSSRKQLLRMLLWFIIGAYIGLHLRSHIMVICIGCVIAVKMFDPRFWKYGVLLLLISPLVISHVTNQITFSSFEQNIIQAERRMKNLVARNRASTFDYGKTGPVPVLSGLKNAQFRPALWPVPNLRSLLSALEIWTISLSIIFLWLRMTNREWRSILRNPSIWVALLVLIPFWIFFTYTPNEGLIARQRIQLFPALLVLFATPILQRRELNREAAPVPSPGATGQAKDSKMDSFLMSHTEEPQYDVSNLRGKQRSQREMV